MTHVEVAPEILRWAVERSGKEPETLARRFSSSKTGWKASPRGGGGTAGPRSAKPCGGWAANTPRRWTAWRGESVFPSTMESE